MKKTTKRLLSAIKRTGRITQTKPFQRDATPPWPIPPEGIGAPWPVPPQPERMITVPTACAWRTDFMPMTKEDEATETIIQKKLDDRTRRAIRKEQPR